MQFNEKLKELRTKKGVSQSELADGIYVSRSAVAKWENGLGLPSNESLRLLAEYFEVSADQLYADSSTEKTIVNKNQIISRSRKLLIIISTACAVAVTAIIILAIVLGYQLNKPAPRGENNYTGPWGVKADMYYGSYDENTGDFIVSKSNATLISYESEYIPANEIAQVKYTLTVGQKYVLTAKSSPSGWNGRQFGISAANVGFKYNTEAFDIDMVCDRHEVDYILTVKQPCQIEPIWLYRISRGEQVTNQSIPSCGIIIDAVAPGEEKA